MIKENLIYPVIKEVDQEVIALYSMDFGLRVHIYDGDIIRAIYEIKRMMIIKMMELSKEDKAIPLPDFQAINGNEIAYIEIDSDFIKVNTERVNMTIPKNLLAHIDAIGLNRSSYVSNLIWDDIFKKISK